MVSGRREGIVGVGVCFLDWLPSAGSPAASLTARRGYVAVAAHRVLYGAGAPRQLPRN